MISGWKIEEWVRGWFPNVPLKRRLVEVGMGNFEREKVDMKST